jgi:glutathione S-transferase
MIVYGSSLSPFVRKTLAYIAEKGLVVETKPTGLNSTDPAFRQASPFGKIPAFRDGDFSISDSTAIITYLETRFPDPPLLPASPESRARVVWFEEFSDTLFVGAGAKLFFNRLVAPRFLGREGDLAVADKAEKEELPPLFDYIERVMPESGFLVDDRLTIADLAVASPFVNLMHVGVSIDAATRPKTAAFVAAMLARPSFASLVAAEKSMLGG